MASITVVMFYSDCMRLPDNMSFGRKNFCKSIPIIGIEHAIFEMFYLIIESLECCSITTAEHPGHSSPCTTVNSLDDPKLSFFETRKCHISSNSISLISPDTSGSGRLSPNVRIQRYTCVWSIFRMRPNIRYEPFAIA